MLKFHLIDDGAVILFSRGRYRQAKVYRCGRDVFAQVGAGFIKLGTATGTSDPHVAFLDVEGTGIDRAHPQAQPHWSETADAA